MLIDYSEGKGTSFLWIIQIFHFKLQFLQNAYKYGEIDSKECLRAVGRISSGGCASGGALLHFLTKSWAFFAWNERGFLVPL